MEIVPVHLRLLLSIWGQKPTTFAELIDAMVLKYSKGKIKMGANLKLPPPLSFMWGEDLLGKHTNTAKQ